MMLTEGVLIFACMDDLKEKMEENQLSVELDEKLQKRRFLEIKDLPCAVFQGICYIDLKSLFFLNHTGMANLIDLCKSLLAEGLKMRLVNAAPHIRRIVKDAELDQFLVFEN